MNYKDKSSDYFSNIRFDLIKFIGKEKNLKILEVGAAFGETLYYLKLKGIATEVVGVELFQNTDRINQYKTLDRFIFGNIEEIDIDYFDYFDIILFPDVLEHLVEPTKVLLKLSKSLKKNGKIIVSMPNIRHYSALNKIFLKGDFSYEESGIFDYTHMRFYCKRNIKNLLERSNFKIVKSESSIKNYKGKSFSKFINTITFGIFEEFLSYQYFFVATM